VSVDPQAKQAHEQTIGTSAAPVDGRWQLSRHRQRAEQLGERSRVGAAKLVLQRRDQLGRPTIGPVELIQAAARLDLLLARQQAQGKRTWAAGRPGRITDGCQVFGKMNQSAGTATKMRRRRTADNFQ
jgi:hypothetical protein